MQRDLAGSTTDRKSKIVAVSLMASGSPNDKYDKDKDDIYHDDIETVKRAQRPSRPQPVRKSPARTPLAAALKGELSETDSTISTNNIRDSRSPSLETS